MLCNKDFNWSKLKAPHSQMWAHLKSAHGIHKAQDDAAVSKKTTVDLTKVRTDIQR